MLEKISEEDVTRSLHVAVRSVVAGFALERPAATELVVDVAAPPTRLAGVCLLRCGERE
jgi:hypothetical protein